MSKGVFSLAFIVIGVASGAEKYTWSRCKGKQRVNGQTVPSVCFQKTCANESCNVTMFRGVKNRRPDDATCKTCIGEAVRASASRAATLRTAVPVPEPVVEEAPRDDDEGSPAQCKEDGFWNEYVWNHKLSVSMMAFPVAVSLEVVYFGLFIPQWFSRLLWGTFYGLALVVLVFGVKSCFEAKSHCDANTAAVPDHDAADPLTGTFTWQDGKIETYSLWNSTDGKSLKTIYLWRNWFRAENMSTDLERDLQAKKDEMDAHTAPKGLGLALMPVVVMAAALSFTSVLHKWYDAGKVLRNVNIENVDSKAVGQLFEHDGTLYTPVVEGEKVLGYHEVKKVTTNNLNFSSLSEGLERIIKDFTLNKNLERGRPLSICGKKVFPCIDSAVKNCLSILFNKGQQRQRLIRINGTPVSRDIRSTHKEGKDNDVAAFIEEGGDIDLYFEEVEDAPGFGFFVNFMFSGIFKGIRLCMVGDMATAPDMAAFFLIFEEPILIGLTPVTWLLSVLFGADFAPEHYSTAYKHILLLFFMNLIKTVCVWFGKRYYERYWKKDNGIYRLVNNYMTRNQMYAFMFSTHIFIDLIQQVFTLCGPSAMRWASQYATFSSDCCMSVSKKADYGGNMRVWAGVFNNMEGFLKDGLFVPLLRYSGRFDDKMAADRAEDLLNQQGENFMLTEEEPRAAVVRFVIFGLLGVFCFLYKNGYFAPAKTGSSSTTQAK